MGRIKTKLIKRTSNKLVNENYEKFNEDFDHNKKAIFDLADVPSKKMRNVMSGYITRLVKQKKAMNLGMVRTRRVVERTHNQK